jgi:hypothetical protein
MDCGQCGRDVSTCRCDFGVVKDANRPMNTLTNLVASNYALRCAGLLPDEWFWADRLLVSIGVFLNWRH